MIPLSIFVFFPLYRLVYLFFSFSVMIIPLKELFYLFQVFFYFYFDLLVLFLILIGREQIFPFDRITMIVFDHCRFRR